MAYRRMRERNVSLYDVCDCIERGTSVVHGSRRTHTVEGLCVVVCASTGILVSVLTPEVEVLRGIGKLHAAHYRHLSGCYHVKVWYDADAAQHEVFGRRSAVRRAVAYMRAADASMVCSPLHNE